MNLSQLLLIEVLSRNTDPKIVHKRNRDIQFCCIAFHQISCKNKCICICAGKRRRSLRPVRKCAQPEAERAEEEVESEHESGQRRRRVSRVASACHFRSDSHPVGLGLIEDRIVFQSVRAPEPMEVDSASESVASGAAAESKPQKVKRKKSLLDNVINEDTASETTSQSVR